MRNCSIKTEGSDMTTKKTKRKKAGPVIDARTALWAWFHNRHRIARLGAKVNRNELARQLALALPFIAPATRELLEGQHQALSADADESAVLVFCDAVASEIPAASSPLPKALGRVAVRPLRPH